MAKSQKIPTHLKMTDKVMVLPLLGMGISSRQLLMLLIGGSCSYDLWLRLLPIEHWHTPVGIIFHWLAVFVVATLTVALALVEVAGRPLEDWLVILLLYWRTPRLCIWRSTEQRSTALSASRR